MGGVGVTCHFCCLKGGVNRIRLVPAEANFFLVVIWLCPALLRSFSGGGAGTGPAAAGLLAIDKSQLDFVLFLALAVLARPPFLPENALGHFVDLGEF